MLSLGFNAKGVVIQGPTWESHEATLRGPLFLLQGGFHMTSNMPGEGSSGEGLNCMASGVLGGERSPWG